MLETLYARLILLVLSTTMSSACSGSCLETVLDAGLFPLGAILIGATLPVMVHQGAQILPPTPSVRGFSRYITERGYFLDNLDLVMCRPGRN